MDNKLKGDQKKIDVNKDGKIDEKDFKILNADRTRGADAQFSRDVEAGNRNRARKQAARIKREMKDADGYMGGGKVKGYEDGGVIKGGSCPHRGEVRGTGAAVAGGKFTGTR